MSPTPPRLRHWAVRLTLLVACIGTVATSKPYSPPVTSEYQGETLRLTTTARTATRHIIVRASADSDLDAGGNVSVQFTPRWLSTRTEATNTPELRVRMRYPEEPLTEGTTYRFDAPPGGQGSAFSRGESFGGDCNLDDTCEWNVLFDIELLGDIGEDVMEVDWKVTASVEAWDTDETPDDFAVHISEP
ncbi:hypothetical protein HPC49_16585 [Pyxidicoccus fallax]|uniref:Uncharacterized protein n=1 Tax=Pyxidicoccus fallax TaxID=394095 RepID=A0A848LM93_9BACT|nr:hypothetical protein [Pyxidicoccus fallax]NMO18898.1 hypothetical protein [Pyxidicoccus fallax]NPC79834.1 hypothetical protein [Pyxidicoccus fallax]